MNPWSGLEIKYPERRKMESECALEYEERMGGHGRVERKQGERKIHIVQKRSGIGGRRMGEGAKKGEERKSRRRNEKGEWREGI